MARYECCFVKSQNSVPFPVIFAAIDTQYSTAFDGVFN